MPNGIHILNGALDEVASGPRSKQIVLRGVVDSASLAQLRVDEYQREPLPLAALSKTNRLRNRKDEAELNAPRRFSSFAPESKDDDFETPAH